MGHFQRENPFAVDATGKEIIPDRFVKRQTLASDGGLIHCGLTAAYAAIHRDAFTGADAQQIADL
jgi:hypothetical protein